MNVFTFSNTFSLLQFSSIFQWSNKLVNLFLDYINQVLDRQSSLREVLGEDALLKDAIPIVIPLVN